MRCPIHSRVLISVPSEPYLPAPQARAIWSGPYNCSMACHPNSLRPCSSSTCAAARMAQAGTAAMPTSGCVSVPSGCAVLFKHFRSTHSSYVMKRVASEWLTNLPTRPPRSGATLSEASKQGANRTWCKRGKPFASLPTCGGSSPRSQSSRPKKPGIPGSSA
ncbi:hypothetical protein D3C79_589320 [compost metagenome]